ncbi:MAG: hypothetical protein WAW96_19725 [Alphaproteobacteria bacterium]
MDKARFAAENLIALIEPRIGGSVSGFEAHEDREHDDRALKALNDNALSDSKRRRGILAWLSRYGVLKGIKKSARSKVANTILKYADNQRSPIEQGDEAGILAGFAILHEACRRKVKRRKNRSLRDLSSLTSKAFWLCYPDVVPILDSHTERSLYVISRLVGIGCPEGDRYACFLHVWLSIYRILEPNLSKEKLRGQRPVRIFDYLLWTLGQPNFEVSKSSN